MRIQFSSSTPVCWATPDVSPDHYLERQWVLCPVIAYRVLLAESKSASLNVFERVILDLSRAGVREPNRITACSGLQEGLVQFVTESLRGKGLIAKDGFPTVAADRELDESDESTTPSIPALAFIDPYSQSLWPRIALGELPQAMSATIRGSASGQVCDFAAGDVGKPTRGKALVLSVDAQDSSAPRPRHVIEALRRHLSAFRSSAQRRTDRAESMEAVRPIQASRVRITAAAPFPLYLLTFVYISKHAVREQVWSAADPFGLGRDDFAERIIRAQLRHNNNPLNEAIDTLVGRATEVGRVERGVVHSEQRERALTRVEHAIGRNPSTLGPEYLELTARLMHADIELQGFEGKSSGGRGNVVSSVYGVLEEAFALVQRGRGSTAQLSRLTEHDGDANRSELERIAVGARFEVSQHADGLRFLKLSRNKVKSVVEFPGRHLASQIAAALLAMSEFAGHPMAALGCSWPGAIAFCARLIAARNPESHGTGEGVVLDPTTASEGMYRILRSLFSFQRREADPTEHSSTAVDAQHGFHHRIHLAALHAVRSRHEGTLEGREHLFNRLVRMQRRAELLREVSPDDLVWGIAQSHSIELLREGGGAIEQLLAECLQSGERPQFAPNAFEFDRQLLEQLVIEIGFTLDEAGLPQSLWKMKPKRVAESIVRGQGTLGALLLANMIAARSDHDHPLRMIARERKSFVADIGQFITMRDHADRPLDSAAEAEATAELVHQLTECVMETLSQTIQAEPMERNQHVETKAH